MGVEATLEPAGGEATLEHKGEEGILELAVGEAADL